MEDDAPVIYGLEFQVGLEETQGRCRPWLTRSCESAHTDGEDSGLPGQGLGRKDPLGGWASKAEGRHGPQRARVRPAGILITLECGRLEEQFLSTDVCAGYCSIHDLQGGTSRGGSAGWVLLNILLTQVGNIFAFLFFFFTPSNSC